MPSRSPTASSPGSTARCSSSTSRRRNTGTTRPITRRSPTLRLPGGCELYLGVIHHDDRDGDRRRIAAAAQTVSDFGIATECGWGRGDPARAPGLLDSHRIALEQG